MDLEQKAIERIRLASDLSLKHYGKPLVCTYSGGKDSEAEEYDSASRRQRNLFPVFQ